MNKTSDIVIDAKNGDWAAHMSEIRELYQESGVVIMRDFFNRETIDHTISEIAALVRLQARGIDEMEPFLGAEDQAVLEDGIVRLAKAKRSALGAVYDGSMKLLGVRGLGNHPDAAAFAKGLLDSQLVSISNNILVRYDLPGEERFLFNHWHQDYPYAMVSLHGVVFWIPITEVELERGPVRIVPGSHKKGLRRHYYHPEHHHLTIRDDEDLQGAEELRVPVKAGDLVAFDILLAHRSSVNLTNKPRVSISFRYCDMTHPESAQMGWPCYYSQGKKFDKVHPSWISEPPGPEQS